MLKKTQTSIQKIRKSKPLFFYSSLLVLFLSFYLKAEPGFFNISHFSFDQGEDIILAKNLVVDHHLSLISRGSGLEGVFMGPGYTWFLAIPFFLSGGSPNFNVIYFAFLSTLTSIATYFIVRRITDHTAASIASLYVALAPSFVGLSKIVLSPNPIIFFNILHIWFIYQICLKKKDNYLPALTFLISVFFHFEIGYSLFALFSSLIVIFLYRQFPPFISKPGLTSIITLLIPFGPQLLFDFRHNFLISHSLLNYFTGSNQSLGSSNLSLTQRIPSRLGSFTQDLLGSISFSPESTILVITSLLLMAYGWFLIVQHKNHRYQQLGLLTALLLIFIYIGFIFYPGPLWPWYRSGLPAFFTLLAALALAQIFKSTSTFARTTTSLFLIIAIFSSFCSPDRINAITGNYSGNVSTIQNQHRVLDSIYTSAQQKPFALYIYTPPVYPNIWDYQLYQYAEPKYGYLPKPYDVMPQANNPANIYLLIETDVEFPIWIHGWRDNFTHYGEMIDSWEFDFGVRVEQWSFTSEPTNTNPLIREVFVWPSSS